jgi:hypothetical protein
MIDYILRFPSKQVAEQFGLANGFAYQNEDGAIVSNLASHEHALCEVGEHDGDGQYWVLFRDLVGIPIPAGGEQFIYWSSQWAVLDENGDEISVPRPINDPNVPNIWWA